YCRRSAHWALAPLQGGGRWFDTTSAHRDAVLDVDPEQIRIDLERHSQDLAAISWPSRPFRRSQRGARFKSSEDARAGPRCTARAAPRSSPNGLAVREPPRQRIDALPEDHFQIEGMPLAVFAA